MLAHLFIGRKVFVRVGTICCDRPAAVAVTGSPHFTKRDSLCMKCTVPRSRLYSSALHSPRNGAEHSQAMLAQQCEFLKQFEQARKLHGNPVWLAVQAAKLKRLGRQWIPWSNLSSRYPVICQFLTFSQISIKFNMLLLTRCIPYSKEFFPSIFDGSVFWGGTALYLQQVGRWTMTEAVSPH